MLLLTGLKYHTNLQSRVFNADSCGNTGGEEVSPGDNLLVTEQLKLQKGVVFCEVTLKQFGDGNDLVVLNAVGSQGNCPAGGIARQKLGPEMNVGCDLQTTGVRLQLVANQ